MPAEIATESAELHLVVVARVEQRDVAAFVEPLLEGRGVELGRGAHARTDAFDSKGDDLFFDPHQHASEGLIGALAEFWSQAAEARNGAEFRNQVLNLRRAPGDEQIHALGAQQNRAFQSPRLAKIN